MKGEKNMNKKLLIPIVIVVILVIVIGIFFATRGAEKIKGKLIVTIYSKEEVPIRSIDNNDQSPNISFGVQIDPESAKLFCENLKEINANYTCTLG